MQLGVSCRFMCHCPLCRRTPILSKDLLEALFSLGLREVIYEESWGNATELLIPLTVFYFSGSMFISNVLSSLISLVWGHSASFSIF